ncbi:MAG: hypothetical protein F4Y45_00840 [Acidobacteria bacterium]|nr:hypothetical protein [Acidobacteriota bacterium]MYD69193.1 hypothetical protein [Acidobacteriota bacterium]MYJ04850.1 hypothetical protein [Acidobacteriota bacterium]
MLDTHAIARSLSATKLTPAQVDAITAGIAAAAERGSGDAATKADLAATRADVTAELAVLRAEVAALETRLTWRLVGAMAAIGAALRFIG